MNMRGTEPSIPLASPNLCGNEEAYVVFALLRNWLSSVGD